MTDRVARKDLVDGDALYKALQEELLPYCSPANSLGMPASAYVILMVGVNGAGKTTTIGKLARRLQSEGKSVMLAAGDTRAAAVEQLQAWGQRNDVPVIAQHTGADAASVIFDALQAARPRCGRSHRRYGGAPPQQGQPDGRAQEGGPRHGQAGSGGPPRGHAVLDAGMGQNALAQAEHFREAVGVTGVTLTKLDGTPRHHFRHGPQAGLPTFYRHRGKAEDLRPFQAVNLSTPCSPAPRNDCL